MRASTFLHKKIHWMLIDTWCFTCINSFNLCNNSTRQLLLCLFYEETDAERLNSVPTSQIMKWHNCDISSGNNMTPELMLFTSILVVILPRLLHRNNNKKATYYHQYIWLSIYQYILNLMLFHMKLVQTRQTCSNTSCTFLYMLPPAILNIRVVYSPYHQSVKTLILKASLNDNSSM